MRAARRGFAAPLHHHRRQIVHGLLADKILDCLTAREMQSVVAHELCHLRRRDNLASVIHIAAEVVFWFHPLGVVARSTPDRRARTGR
jgi:beta-lactamase regulating signal transducer with metallopeptidase domain